MAGGISTRPTRVFDEPLAAVRSDAVRRFDYPSGFIISPPTGWRGRGQVIPQLKPGLLIHIDGVSLPYISSETCWRTTRDSGVIN